MKEGEGNRNFWTRASLDVYVELQKKEIVIRPTWLLLSQRLKKPHAIRHYVSGERQATAGMKVFATHGSALQAKHSRYDYLYTEEIGGYLGEVWVKALAGRISARCDARSRSDSSLWEPHQRPLANMVAERGRHV